MACGADTICLLGRSFLGQTAATGLVALKTPASEGYVEDCDTGGIKEVWVLYSQNLCALRADLCQRVSSHGILAAARKISFSSRSMCPFRGVLPISFPLPRLPVACAATCHLAKHHAICNLDDASKHGGTCRVQQRLQEGPDLYFAVKGTRLCDPSDKFRTAKVNVASLITQAMQHAGATMLSSPLLPAMVLTSTCCGINSTNNLVWLSA